MGKKCASTGTIVDAHLLQTNAPAPPCAPPPTARATTNPFDVKPGALPLASTEAPVPRKPPSPKHAPTPHITNYNTIPAHNLPIHTPTKITPPGAATTVPSGSGLRTLPPNRFQIWVKSRLPGTTRGSGLSEPYMSTLSSQGDSSTHKQRVRSRKHCGPLQMQALPRPCS